MTAQQLKNSILQMAVQGKLVPQNPDDEPASVLLERIKAEKQKLIKEGKIKKDKKSSEIFRGASRNIPYTYCEQIGKEIKDISAEIPFDIPESWEWCRLSFVNNIYTGNSINENEKRSKYTGLSNGRFYIGTKDIEFNHTIKYNNGVRIPYNNDKFRIAPCNCILMCIEGGSAGKKIAFTNQDVCFGNKLCCFVSYGINYLFLYYYLQSPIFQSSFKENTTGIIGGVSLNVLKNLLLPIPPLSEQHQIVSKIEKLLPYIEAYEKAETELLKLNKEFPEKLKKSILQEAVQGKLVPQNPDDEPASVLLKRIRDEKNKLIKAGKIKKDKHESVIFTRDKIPYEMKDGKERSIADEIPFEIPESWEWCRLSDIVSILGDGIHGTPEYCETGNYYFINGNNLDNGKIIIKDSTKKVDKTQFEKYKKELNINTVFVSINGTIGNIAFYNNEPIILGKSACYFNLISFEMRLYIYQLLKTDYFLTYAVENATGSTIKNVSLKTMKDLLVPLPPLAEQKRIVEKIEKLMSIINSLSK